MKAIWNFFNSLKLTVVLVLAISAVTIYGSIVVYVHPELFGELDQKIFFPWLFGPGPTVIRFTWWFFLLVFLVVLFGINTFVCTVERLPRVIRKYKDPLLNMREVEIGGSAGESVSLRDGGKDRLLGILRQNKYSVYTDGNGLYAEKNRWLPFLPYVVHIGVLLFLVAHLIGSLAGYRHSGLYILEGETVRAPEGGIELRLNKVKVEQREDGSLKDYGSLLTAIKDGQELKTGWVTANKPMFAGGGAIYQREFGQTFAGLLIQAGVKSTGFNGILTAPKGSEYVVIPGSPYRIRIDRFIQDFDLDEQGQPYSRSENLVNPAIFVVLVKDGKEVAGGWIFLREPTRNTFRYEDVALGLADIDMRAYSSFDMNRDPSAILALIASALVMFGTIITLYFRRERVWGNLDEAGGRAQIICTEDEIYEKLGK